MLELDQSAKQDLGKPEWNTLCWGQLEKVVKVRMFGNQKYKPDSWKQVEKVRYENALMRHAVAYMQGENIDKESGMEHLAHLICNAMFIMWFDENRVKYSLEDKTDPVAGSLMAGNQAKLDEIAFKKDEPELKVILGQGWGGFSGYFDTLDGKGACDHAENTTSKCDEIAFRDRPQDCSFEDKFRASNGVL